VVLRLLFKLAVVTASVFVSLAAGEVYVRSFRADQVDSEVLRERLKEGSIAHFIRPTTSAGLYYELIPSHSARLLASQINTDAAGCRIDPEAPSPTGRPLPRIAVLGDSTSFGWGVEYRQSYPELVRSRVETRLGHPLEMRNYSVPGYNSEQELAAFLQKIVPSRPDLVILHHDPNDADPVGLGFGMTSDYLAPEYGDNLLSSALLKLVIREWKIRQNQRAFAYDNSVKLVGGAIASGSLYDRHTKALESLAAAAKTAQVPVVAILFNGRVQADNHYRDSEIYLAHHRRLQERLQEMGFFVLDLYPFYQERLRQEGWKDLTPVWRSPGDAHPNPAGHRMIADVVTEFILGRPELVQRLAAK
jgi:hypothetical protein